MANLPSRRGKRRVGTPSGSSCDCVDAPQRPVNALLSRFLGLGEENTRDGAGRPKVGRLEWFKGNLAIPAKGGSQCGLK